MNRYLLGALAGCAATLPMTIMMVALHRRLPPEERYPLPPAEITLEVAEKAGVDEYLQEETAQAAASLTAHFGLGAAAGAVYSAASGLPLPPPVKGGIFGLAVWSVSYLGLLPAAHVLIPATEHPARRNALMIAANVLWGAVTASLFDRFDPGGQEKRGGRS